VDAATATVHVSPNGDTAQLTLVGADGIQLSLFLCIDTRNIIFRLQSVCITKSCDRDILIEISCFL